MFKKKKLNRLKGEIPLFYNRESLYTICVLINILVDEVNRLSDEVERLSKISKEGADNES